MAPLERPPVISLIWPSDQGFYPKWPLFKLIIDFIKTNTLTKFQVNWARNVASRAPTTVESGVKHLIASSTYKVFLWHSDLFLYPRWPKFKLVQDFIKTNILTKHFIKTIQTLCSGELKMWPLEHPQGISLIWPSDLVYHPRWPKCEYVQDFIKTIVLTKF